MSENKDLSPEEKKAFEGLEKTFMPEIEIENQIVNSLKEKGLIKEQKMKTRKLTWVYQLAASIVLLLVGYVFGNINFSAPTMPRYMILLHEDKNFDTSNEMQKVEEYYQWFLDIQAEGRYITGEKLDDKMAFINNTDKSNQTGAKVSGFFIIEAKDYQEANKISKTNPHLKYGGSIELRPIVDTH